MAINYPERNSGHKNSFEIGNEFQDFVCIELAKDGIILQNINSKKFQFEKGENLQGFEIKFDNTHTKTKRLSIEIAEKRKGENINFVDSGIYRKDNTWLYIQGNYELFFIFPVNYLRQLHKSGRYKTDEYPRDLPTIKKFYLPWSDCVKYCCKYYDLKEVLND
jgi:hypothetical protein